MALIECGECGHKVSTKAQSCPSCGCLVSNEEKELLHQALFERIEKEEQETIQQAIGKLIAIVALIVLSFIFWDEIVENIIDPTVDSIHDTFASGVEDSIEELLSSRLIPVKEIIDIDIPFMFWFGDPVTASVLFISNSGNEQRISVELVPHGSFFLSGDDGWRYELSIPISEAIKSWL